MQWKRNFVSTPLHSKVMLHRVREIQPGAYIVGFRSHSEKHVFGKLWKYHSDFSFMPLSSSTVDKNTYVE
jgi:hypothetical protein